MGWDGGQKCPLIFFTLCRCIRYISTYARNKIVPTFLWVSKFDAKLGCGRKINLRQAGDFSIFEYKSSHVYRWPFGLEKVSI